MAVPLPNLDDRRWVDLVEEGRSLIPFYAPQWTDHNIHDPGITIIELLAAIAEMDIYQLNRIPIERKLKFLALIGVYPFPPRASRTVMSFTVKDSATPFFLPAQVEFEGKDLHGETTRFRTLEPLTLVANELAAVQVKNDNAFQDLTSRWQRGEEIQLLGANPAPGAALYLGFTAPLPRNLPVDLFFTFGDLQVMAAEEERLRLELKQGEAACRSPRTNPCQDDEALAEPVDAGKQLLSHHSAFTVWEFLSPGGDWTRLDAADGQVSDETRAFTLNGRVRINVPRAMGRRKIGVNAQELFYVRCRVIRGALDAAPVLKSLGLNSVLAEQSTALHTQLAINQNVVAGVEAGATLPTAWSERSFVFTLDNAGRISQLRFIESQPDTQVAPPAFRVLNFTKATATAAGSLSFEAAFIGRSSGEPWQRLTVSQLSVVAEGLRLFTLEGESWREWTAQPDFDSSTSADTHYWLDAEKGSVLFGDGDRGRIPPAGALVFVTGYETRAELGNLQPGSVDRLSDNPHNRALLTGFDPIKKDLAAVTNSIAGSGGDQAETIEEATERARQLIEKPNRAVTLGDYETLAMETPGVRIARVSARANLHPAFPCYSAPGIVTVIVLPSLPAGRPVPSLALRRTISAYLSRRRVIGTRVEVTGPTYRKISVQASVQSATGINTVALQATLTKNIDRFFDPLVGGPDGTGWPFGRDVYRSEVLQIIDETPGVENVLALELRAGDGRPQCGNICIGPTGLVDPGEHEIEVL
jgi:hypothetical protein